MGCVPRPRSARHIENHIRPGLAFAPLPQLQLHDTPLRGTQLQRAAEPCHIISRIIEGIDGGLSRLTMRQQGQCTVAGELAQLQQPALRQV